MRSPCVNPQSAHLGQYRKALAVLSFLWNDGIQANVYPNDASYQAPHADNYAIL